MIPRLLPFLACAALAAGEPLALAALPEGGLRERLVGLPAAARARALAVLGRRPELVEDARHLRVSPSGGLRYGDCCAMPVADLPAAAVAPAAAAAAIAVADLPAYSSRPGASRTVVLNFAGATVSGTDWNDPAETDYISFPTYQAKPFSLDADTANFSAAEIEAIRVICERVAEDLRPFDIDVTTVDPGSSGPSIGRVLITSRTDALGNLCPYGASAGGVAYIDVFGAADYATYAPAWVYHDNLANDATYIAEAVAHEFGHNLGLSHDGTASASYYAGHGSPLSWGPIMGASYGKQVTQWSRGEYAGANRPYQDDLAIIAGKLTWIPDDHGGTVSTATVPAFSAAPDGGRSLAVDGVISSAADADLFRFASAAGTVTFTATPFTAAASGTAGANLDIRLDILDASGDPVAGLAADPIDVLAATLTGALPAAGTYHLRVRGAGNRDPLSTGYSAYGSIGSYTLVGTVPTDLPGSVSFTAAAVAVDEGAGAVALTVRRSAGAVGAVSVAWGTADGSAVAGIDYAAASGTLHWADGDASDRTVAVAVIDNAVDQADRAFTVALGAPAGGLVLGIAPTVVVTVRDDDTSVLMGGGGTGGGSGGGGGCGAGPAALLLALAPLLLRRRRR